MRPPTTRGDNPDVDSPSPTGGSAPPGDGDPTTLYLRGMPRRIVREAKAVAARRGVTLAKLVSESLTQTLEIDPTSDYALPPKLQADAHWYETHKKKLVSQHGGEYLAIVNQRVVDHDIDFAHLAERVFSSLGTRPVFMPRCVSEERTVRLRSPHIVRH